MTNLAVTLTPSDADVRWRNWQALPHSTHMNGEPHVLNRDASVAVIEGAKDANTPTTTEIRGDFTRSRSLAGRRLFGYPRRLPEFVDPVPRTSPERQWCLGAPHTRA